MLSVSNLNFSYQTKQVLRNINFTVKPGKQLAILGESGCGKSTLIKLLYGLLDGSEDSLITWHDKLISGPKNNLVPGMDFIKYQAQDFDLMPYTTVSENVGKFLSNINPQAKANRVKLLLEIVEMSEYINTKAQFLSGGQMQRVALAKALAKEPEILLLDEPFSHIDTFRKNSLSRNIFRYLKDKGITCIVATHDSVDALAFADDLLIMREGEIVATGNPIDVYYNPKHHYVASLFGDVNEMKVGDFLDVEETLNKTIYKHPNQLAIVDKSKLTAVVKRCFFEGGSYLVEVTSRINNQTIYVQNKTRIDEGTIVAVALK